MCTVQVGGVSILFSPGEGSPTTGKFLRQNEEVDCCASWSFNGHEKSVATFVKLTDGRGWVMSIDGNGQTILGLVVANPLMHKQYF